MKRTPEWKRLQHQIRDVCLAVQRDQARINRGEPVDQRISVKYV